MPAAVDLGSSRRWIGKRSSPSWVGPKPSSAEGPAPSWRSSPSASVGGLAGQADAAASAAERADRFSSVGAPSRWYGLGVAASLDPIAQRIASIFREFAGSPERAISEIEAVYHPAVAFRDPIQAFEGRDTFVEMNLKLSRTMSELSFDVHDVGAGSRAVFLAWTMRARPRRGPRLVIEGVTHATVVDGLVVEHVDHWDLLGTFADTLPGAGRAYRKVVHALLG